MIPLFGDAVRIHYCGIFHIILLVSSRLNRSTVALHRDEDASSLKKPLIHALSGHIRNIELRLNGRIRQPWAQTVASPDLKS